jgi:hypothetical protein
VSIYVVDLLEIESAKQAILVDFVVRATWHDEGLAGQSNEVRYFSNSELWTPQIQIVGNLGLRELGQTGVEVSPDGTVGKRTRYFGRVTSRMNLEDFPIDQQRIKLQVVSGSREAVLFVIDEAEMGKAETLTIADWSIGEGTAYLVPFSVVSRELPSVAYEFIATRHFGYYLWKVMTPLFLIVLMSWAVFWIDPTNFGPQFGAATASMLTLIAYRFVLGNLVPKVSYFTRMDTFTKGATILVFSALVQAVLTARLVALERIETARKVDLVCRALFPAVFVGLLVFAFFL